MKIKFNLEEFKPIDEGERTLRISEAKCIPSGKPQKIEITFVDTQTQRSLKNSYSFTSEGGMRAFGFLCRVALNIPDLGEFDTADIDKLVGKTLICNVVHTQGTTMRENGTYPIFANISRVISLAGNTATEEVSPRNAIASDDLN